MSFKVKFTIAVIAAVLIYVLLPSSTGNERLGMGIVLKYAHFTAGIIMYAMLDKLSKAIE